MNITQRCREFALTEFDTTLGGKLDSVWREAFNHVQDIELKKMTSTAKVSGKGKIHVPASSVATVYVRVNKRATDTSAWLLLEPGSTPLPGGLIPMPTLVAPKSQVLPVQVVNLSQEDVWLPPNVQLGVLTPCQCVESDVCEVRFHSISADHEEVSVDQRDKPESDNSPRNLLSKLHIGGTPEQQARLCGLLTKYADVFAVCDEDLGYSDRVKHEIHLTDDAPVAQPYRRIPPTQFEEVKEHISGLLRKGVIQESSSPYASPIVLVRKADGSLRLYYRRFIEGFSQVAGPLHDLVNMCLRDTSPIKAAQLYKSSWTSQCQTAFESLKDKLTSAPMLGYADFTLPFVLETDASNLGLGAVLYQHQKGEKTVIAYASRRLRGAEKNNQNYSSMKLELLALKWAVTEKFRSYLLGCKFTIITDNNPLCHLTTTKLGAIEQRWAAQLAVFDFEVRYHPGRCNTAADALSRRPGSNEPHSESEDAEYDGCVAICNSLRTGTALGPALLAAGVECSRVRQIQAALAGEDDLGCENTPTLPGYSKAELRQFQETDPTLGYSLYYLLFGVQPHLPVDALLGQEPVTDDKSDWLKVHQERLGDAHIQAKEYTERKAVERAMQHEEKVYCPAVEIGQHVYLQHRPPGRNKIQDAWSSTVYRVLEVQGTTYTVEPVEGDTVQRVHRSNLRPCNNPVPVPMPRNRKPLIKEVCTSTPESGMPSLEVECVLVEEVLCPVEKLIVAPNSECPKQPVPELEDCFYDQVEQSDTNGDSSGPESHGIPDGALEVMPTSVDSGKESVHLPAGDPVMRPVPAPRNKRGECVKLEVPCPVICKTQRTTAGAHSNPYRLPRSVCNAVSFSPDVLSQVLARMILYTTGQLQGGKMI
ncbi:hypothetical protein QTP86_019142, partial [Hemibagrus guttatus]